MRVTHDERQLRVRVHRMAYEAAGVMSVTFRSLDGEDLPSWTPGSHLDLLLPGIITRQYSLCGSPKDQSSWRIAVLREVESKGGSKAVHETLRPGDIVDLVGPRNNFTLVESQRYLFIAGGIGITPIVPMVENAMDARAEWRLVYGGRSRKSMAFASELERLGGNVNIRPQDEFGLLNLGEYLDEPVPDTVIYCCGPERLLSAVEEASAHWPEGSLHVERFAPKVQEPADTAELPFDVTLQRSGRVVHVPLGRSILEAVEEDGVYPPNSCREGICGTCETGVLKGVPDHRDSILTDRERAEGKTMMICVGRSKTPQLVLDM